MEDLRRELENAKASGEISQALSTKMFWVMTTMEDGVEKQQLKRTCYEFMCEMDPNEYEKMVTTGMIGLYRFTNHFIHNRPR